MADNSTAFYDMIEVADASAADTDLTTAGSVVHGPCSMIECVAAGNLSVKTKGSNGTSRTITSLAAGSQVPIQGVTIDHTATTVTRLRVYW